MRALAAITLIALAGACDDKREPPVLGHAAMADSADQVMFGASFNMTERGVIRAELQADTAYFFDDNTRIELDDVNTIFYTTAGMKDAVLTSNHGRYSTRMGNMTAYGNVVVNTEAGRSIVTPELHYSQAANQFSSDSHFVMTEPGRRLEGIGFRSDPGLNNVQVLRSASGAVSGQGRSAPAPSPAAPPGPAAARPGVN
ncbi:MAG TPA: LPS export ABC transporter periplasmic protein LptC [Gemmatimonadaceae bacterium]|nr:LPS export ABC transporter periplasmic protein LptC [Gemmatimonadaceae bacterium]